MADLFRSKYAIYAIKQKRRKIRKNVYKEFTVTTSTEGFTKKINRNNYCSRVNIHSRLCTKKSAVFFMKADKSFKEIVAEAKIFTFYIWFKCLLIV